MALEQLTAAVRAIEARRRGVDGIAGERIDDARPGLLAIEGGAGRQYWTGVRACSMATPRSRRGSTAGRRMS